MASKNQVRLEAVAEVHFDLLAQPVHMHIERAGIAQVGGLPHLFHQLAARDNFIRAAHQQSEQTTLLGRQVMFILPDPQPALLRVELDGTDDEDVVTAHPFDGRHGPQEVPVRGRWGQQMIQQRRQRPFCVGQSHQAGFGRQFAHLFDEWTRHQACGRGREQHKIGLSLRDGLPSPGL